MRQSQWQALICCKSVVKVDQILKIIGAPRYGVVHKGVLSTVFLQEHSIARLLSLLRTPIVFLILGLGFNPTFPNTRGMFP